MIKDESLTMAEEEKVTARVIAEQAVRIVSVISILFAVFMPIVICDALGSVASIFSLETGIPLNVTGDSQTQFVWNVVYLIQNSADSFLPFDLFKTGAQWITSSTGFGASLLGAAGMICTGFMYLIPLYLFIVLKVSRYYEGKPIDAIKKVSMPVCSVIYLAITGILAGFSIGYWWNFFWEYDTHYDFALQFFAAYGGVKITILMVLALLLTVGCVVLTIFDKKSVE